MLSANTVIGVLLIGISLYFFIIATGFPEAFVYKSVGPSLWPMLVLLGLIGCGVGHIFQSYVAARLFPGGSINEEKRIKAENEEEKTEVDEIGINGRYRKYINLIAIVSLSVLMIFACSKVGFIVTVPPVLFFMMLVLGVKRIPLAIFLSLGLTALIVVIFGHLIGVLLPRGLGPFRDINMFFLTW